MSVKSKNVSCSKINQDKALLYSEKYGIIRYRVVGHYLIYNESYPAYLGNKAYTVQHTVDLDSYVMESLSSCKLRLVQNYEYFGSNHSARILKRVSR